MSDVETGYSVFELEMAWISAGGLIEFLLL
jgi:hypothetical protein